MFRKWANSASVWREAPSTMFAGTDTAARRICEVRPNISAFGNAAVASYARVIGAPLLILGERGTGKTRLVETIVATLKGRKKVVTVPCGGLDSALAESLLFGHRKGAFTGAAADRPGLLAEAGGGILFLDEVQDLPKPAQRKLVRVF